MVKRVVASLFLLGLVGAGGSFGWQWWHTGRFIQSTDDAYVHSDITAISPKISGYVAELTISDNQRVAAGDVLVRIDDRDYRAKLAEAEAVIEARQAALAMVTDRLALQQSLIAQATAEVSAADAEVKRARLDHDRVKRLLRDEWATRQRFDLSEADSTKASAVRTRTQAGAEGTRRQVAVLESERRQDEALLHQAEATRDVVKSALEDTIIRAPVAGIVGNRAVHLGQYVQPGAMLMALVPLPNVWVEANFKETQVGRMAPGQNAELAVDGLGGRKLSGRIDSFAPASGSQFSLLPQENATGNFTKVVQRIPVKIAIDSADPLALLLRPGMSVVVSIDTRNSSAP